MYPPKAFSSEDLEEAVEIAACVQFASIAVLVSDPPEVVFAPFVVDRAPGGAVTFFAHLVRTNPLFNLLSEAPREARLVFQAADGYLSPSVYEQKRISGRVVPTWNYVACQFRGRLEKVDDAQLPAVLARQVEDFEHAAGSAWRLEDAPEDFVDALAKAVFPLRFRPTRWRVHKKLSQNRHEDLPSIREWFRDLSQPHKSIAHWIAKR